MHDVSLGHLSLDFIINRFLVQISGLQENRGVFKWSRSFLLSTLWYSFNQPDRF